MTSDALGVPVDLGASWIHGTSGNPISGLANAANVDMVTSRFAAFGTFDTDGRLLPTDVDASLYEYYGHILDLARRSATSPDVAVGEALRMVRDSSEVAPPVDIDRDLVKAYLDWIVNVDIGINQAADPGDLSMRALGDGDTGPWVQMQQGYRAVFEPLAANLDIRLGDPIVAIGTDGAGPRGIGLLSLGSDGC